MAADTLHDRLVAALKECRDATAAAMRVIADLDARGDADPKATRTQRFIDELHLAGVRDGFGLRADQVLKEARANGGKA